MSIEKLISKIFEDIDQNKKILKEAMVKPIDVASSYPDLIFATRTQKDDINQALLDDLQKASDITGLKVNVNFAKTDHGKNTASGNVSRHYTNQAVDIGSIGGKIVSPNNRDVVNKYVNALVSMGYTKNSEGGNPKSVLTFGFPAHDDHIHVSNTTGSSSVVSNTSDSSYDVDDRSQTAYDYATSQEDGSSPKELIGLRTLTIPGIFESVGFGKNVSNRYGRLIIPKDTNPKIKSPISGVIDNRKYFPSCVNQVTVRNDDGGTTYLQYCGISSPKRLRNEESVSIGDTLGSTDTDVEVNYYDASWNKLPISSAGISIEKSDTDTEKKKNTTEPEYYDPLMAALLLAPSKIFKDKFKDGNRVEKRYGGVSDKQQVDPFVLNFLKDPFNRKKVNENIEKIKKML
jgi:hypothetical protein